MKISVTIEANTESEYANALSALAYGMGKPVDFDNPPVLTRVVGSAPELAAGYGDEPSDEWSESDHAAHDQAQQAEERQKRKRRTKAEIAADNARLAQVAALGTGDPEKIAAASQTLNAAEVAAAPAQDESPSVVDDAFDDVPAFLRGTPAAEPSGPTLKERAEALANDVGQDFIQEVLRQLKIAKLDNATAAQVAALEKIVSKVEENMAQTKAAVARGLSATAMATGLITNLGIKIEA
jgi:hypothetical protein